MPNRYANLTPTKKISEDFQNITIGFDRVQDEMDDKAPGSTAVDLAEHVADDVVHVTQADHDKLNSVAAGAEPNQNAFSQVNDIAAGDTEDTITIKGGTGITVTTNPLTNELEITATGEAIPGAHGTSHLEFGADPIPLATETDGGLMSAADKAALDGMAGGISDLAGVGRTTETVKGNADAIAAHLAETVTGILNVKTGFGAKGDGVNDDSTAISAAMTSAKTAGKGVIFFPPGNYLFKSRSDLTDASNITIIGYGATIKADSSMPDSSLGAVLSFTRCSNVHILGLSIDGNVQNRTWSGGIETPAHNLRLYACADFTIRDVKSINAMTDGIYVGDYDSVYSERVLIDHCTLDTNRRQGISIIGGRKCVTRSCYLLNTGTYLGTAPMAGIALEGDTSSFYPTDNTIENCYSNGNVGAGYMLFNGHYNKLTGSYSEGDGIGVIIGANAFNNIVELNVIKSPIGIGIHIQVDNSARVHNHHIKNNKMYNSGGIGIYSEWGNLGTIVDGNDVNGALEFGIRCNNGTKSILNNTIKSVVYKDGTSYHLLIDDIDSIATGNRVEGGSNPAAGIHVMKCGTFRNNFATGCLAVSGRQIYSANFNNPLYVRDVAGNYDQSATSNLMGTNKNIYDSAAPTTGTWVRGDIIWHSSPATSGFLGWICVTGGTPGTWKTFGAISA